MPTSLSPSPGLTPAPISPSAVPSINPWACGLAALTWNLQKGGILFNPETIINLVGSHFPHWTHHLGIMGIEDILSCLKYLRVGYQRMILTPSKTELLDFVAVHHGTYLMGFVRTRNPSSHIMPVVSWDGNEVTMMDAQFPKADFVKGKWDDLVTQGKSDFLFLFV